MNSKHLRTTLETSRLALFTAVEAVTRCAILDLDMRDFLFDIEGNSYLLGGEAVISAWIGSHNSELP